MNRLWNSNKIQFPRLISELEADGAFTPEIMRELSEDSTPIVNFREIAKLGFGPLAKNEPYLPFDMIQP